MPTITLSRDAFVVSGDELIYHVPAVGRVVDDWIMAICTSSTIFEFHLLLVIARCERRKRDIAQNVLICWFSVP